MGISLKEWPLWTLKEFHLAYEAWQKVNIREPWERTRAAAWHVARSAGATDVREWHELFELPWDKKKRVRNQAIAREPTKEEWEIINRLPKDNG